MTSPYSFAWENLHACFDMCICKVRSSQNTYIVCVSERERERERERGERERERSGRNWSSVDAALPDFEKLLWSMFRTLCAKQQEFWGKMMWMMFNAKSMCSLSVSDIYWGEKIRGLSRTVTKDTVECEQKV